MTSVNVRNINKVFGFKKEGVAIIKAKNSMANEVQFFTGWRDIYALVFHFLK